MIKASLRLNRNFTKQAKGVFEKYQFEVGVLEDRPHYTAKQGTRGSYAGGPVRKKTSQSELTISEVSERLIKHTGINIYTKPFSKKSKNNREILKFTQAFFDFCAGRTQAKRAENLLQAVVRNPILRGDYGRNSNLTARIKGFNRFMIDTGQLFKAITAKVRLRVSK